MPKHSKELENSLAKLNSIDPKILAPHYRLVIRDVTNYLVILAIFLTSIFFLNRNDPDWNYPYSLFAWIFFVAFNGVWSAIVKNVENYAFFEHFRVFCDILLMVLLFHLTGGAKTNFWYPAAFCIIGSSTTMYLATGKFYWFSLSYPVVYLLIFYFDAQDLDTSVIVRAGGLFFFLVAACILFFRLAKVIGAIGVALSEEQSISADHQKQTAAAVSANQAKSNFIAHINHELRTPLTVITGFADLLSSASQDPAQLTRYAETIKRNADHLNSLVDDILDLSKIESNELITEKVACRPSAEILAITEMFSEKVAAKGIGLSSRIVGNLPEIVEVDCRRMRQILINIVANAVKFTEMGAIELITTFYETDPECGRLSFTCIDTGIGVHPDQHKNVFEPFSQEDSSTSRRYGGTGLGLFLSRKLAHLLGGDIAILKSAPGKGSTFELTIPVRTLKKVDNVRQADYSGNGSTPLILLNKKILLAEDNPDSQALFEKLLTREGALVEIVGDGVDAVEKSNHADFDVILMDLQMPRMDGYEALIKIRQIRPNIPIIAVTANATKEERSKALAMGFTAFQTKPVTFSVLFKLLNDLLN